MGSIVADVLGLAGAWGLGALFSSPKPHTLQLLNPEPLEPRFRSCRLHVVRERRRGRFRGDLRKPEPNTLLTGSWGLVTRATGKPCVGHLG